MYEGFLVVSLRGKILHTLLTSWDWIKLRTRGDSKFSKTLEFCLKVFYKTYLVLIVLKQEFHSKQFEMHSDHSSHKNNHNKNKNSLLPSMFPNPPDDLEISLIPADANDGEVGRVHHHHHLRIWCPLLRNTTSPTSNTVLRIVINILSSNHKWIPGKRTNIDMYLWVF